MTISQLRFGPDLIRSSYLIHQANFVGCHQPGFLERFDVLDKLLPNGTFLLNSHFAADEVWDHLPERVQRRLIEKQARFLVIDAHAVARECGMGGRINTIMQACFFAISGVLPQEEALAAIRDSIRKAYAKKGDEIVAMNLHAIDRALANLHEVRIPGRVTSAIPMRPPVPQTAPEFVRRVLGEMIANRGDRVPVSALPVDGTYPSGTARFEKRNLATETPVWNPNVCIQCGKCVLVCPHAVIRSKVYTSSLLAGAPKGFKAWDARLPKLERSQIHFAGRRGRLHRVRHLRRRLPGTQPI